MQDARRHASAQRADRQIDRKVRARFSAELMSRGPSPLRPSIWPAAVREIVSLAKSAYADVSDGFEVADPMRAWHSAGASGNGLLLIRGFLVTFVLRGWIVTPWRRHRARRGPARRRHALVAVRNVARLMFRPSVRACSFAALDPDLLMARRRRGASSIFPLPARALSRRVGWRPVFRAGMRAHRLVPLAEPRRIAAGSSSGWSRSPSWSSRSHLSSRTVDSDQPTRRRCSFRSS